MGRIRLRRFQQKAAPPCDVQCVCDLVRGDRDAQVLVEDVDDGAGGLVADLRVGADAGQLVDPVGIARLLLPDRKQRELRMGSLVLRGILDGDVCNV